MEKTEIEKELKMTYNELCKYLQDKYGMAKSDYFATEECRSKSKKIPRSSEGLYCHHMDEDKGGNLSNPPQARMQPFEWQKRERLVYCNALEHFILHIKIGVLRHNCIYSKPSDVEAFFTTHGCMMISSEINDMFLNNGTSLAWKQRCFSEFKDNYDDYIVLIKAIMKYIDNAYVGDKTAEPFLKIGAIVHFADCDAKILNIQKSKEAVLLEMPNGERKGYLRSVLYFQNTYADCYDYAIRDLSHDFNDFQEKIYNDIINYPDTDEINEIANILRVDYSDEKFIWGSEAEKIVRENRK